MILSSTRRKIGYLRIETWHERFRYHAEHYLLLNVRLYKRGISTPLLGCLNIEEAKRVLSEIHDGVCGNHSGGQSLAHKALLQGFY